MILDLRFVWKAFKIVNVNLWKPGRQTYLINTWWMKTCWMVFQLVSGFWGFEAKGFLYQIVKIVWLTKSSKVISHFSFNNKVFIFGWIKIMILLLWNKRLWMRKNLRKLLVTHQFVANFLIYLTKLRANLPELFGLICNPPLFDLFEVIFQSLMTLNCKPYKY